ncbi:hypothetical protein LXL04_021131 [Taraxacum kok-saghyz]
MGRDIILAIELIVPVVNGFIFLGPVFHVIDLDIGTKSKSSSESSFVAIVFPLFWSALFSERKITSKVTNEKTKAIPVLNLEENEINNNNPPTNHPPNPPTNRQAIPVKVIPRKATGINIHGNIKDVHPVKMREGYKKNKADQNRGKAIATNEDSDDDFDFRRGPKKDQKRPMRENKKNPKKAKIQTEGDIMKPKAIQLRTSPKVLHSAMQNLKKATKEYAREIGLGHLLQMKVDGSPTKIGYYAVKNFDPKNMVLKVNNGVINITRRVKIDNMEYRSKEDKTVDDWYDQFDGRKDIRPHAVKEAMTCAEHPDLMFKVNLFVLLCNTLGKTNSMGTCDVSMLPKVTKDLDLSNFDWCSYVLKCLEDTRFSWNESSATSYYFGPIILLTIFFPFKFMFCLIYGCYTLNVFVLTGSRLNVEFPPSATGDRR